MTAPEKYNGKTRAEWANELGITTAAMISRIKKNGWEYALSLGGPVLVKRKRTAALHTYKGVTKTMLEWAISKGMDKPTLAKRVRKYGFDAAIRMSAERVQNAKGNKTGDRFKGKLITWKGATRNLKEWGVVFGRSGSVISKNIQRFGSFQAAFEYMESKPSKVARQHDSVSNRKALDILRDKNGPGLQYGSNFSGGKVSSSKNDIKEIIECETIFSPLKITKQGFGISAITGYKDDPFSGARKTPSNESGFSMVIRRGLERGAIKCAETGKAAVALLCSICTINQCVVRICGG